VLLLEGNFAEGWSEYEWRWQQPETRRRDLPGPVWNGEALDGRQILIYAEQGLGDTIQFLRYLPLVGKAGGKVILECQPALASFLSDQADLGTVISAGSQLPEFALHVPLLSLPRIFGGRLDNIPAHAPYLAADLEKAELWRKRLAALPGLRVGVAWAGNPRHPNDRERSIPPHRLAPLAEVPGVSWVSLQQGVANGISGLRFESLPPFDGIADTAAVIAGLDLVISADTMIAHLAGALGRPVWTLLSYAADFRWLLDREDAPWYPTMRLFRQPSRGAWDAVLGRVAEDLRDVARG
jgi:hypothetical protein